MPPFADCRKAATNAQFAHGGEITAPAHVLPLHCAEGLWDGPCAEPGNGKCNPALTAEPCPPAQHGGNTLYLPELESCRDPLLGVRPGREQREMCQWAGHCQQWALQKGMQAGWQDCANS